MRRATIAVDPHLLVLYDAGTPQYMIARDRYRFRIGASSRDLGHGNSLPLPRLSFANGKSKPATIPPAGALLGPSCLGLWADAIAAEEIIA